MISITILYQIVLTGPSYTTARANLAEKMERVCSDHLPVIITRKEGASIVMISLEDYQAIEETLYLFHTPTNARRLLDSIDEREAGSGVVKRLTD